MLITTHLNYILDIFIKYLINSFKVERVLQQIFRLIEKN